MPASWKQLRWRWDRLMLCGLEVDQLVPYVRAPCLSSGEQREGVSDLEMRFINWVNAW